MSTSRAANSSPPMRAMMSLDRKVAVRASATRRSVSSPAWWPAVSLIALRLSTSQKKDRRASPWVGYPQLLLGLRKEAAPVRKPGEMILMGEPAKLSLELALLADVLQHRNYVERGALLARNKGKAHGAGTGLGTAADHLDLKGSASAITSPKIAKDLAADRPVARTDHIERALLGEVCCLIAQQAPQVGVAVSDPASCIEQRDADLGVVVGEAFETRRGHPRRDADSGQRRRQGLVAVVAVRRAAGEVGNRRWVCAGLAARREQRPRRRWGRTDCRCLPVARRGPRPTTRPCDRADRRSWHGRRHRRR